MLFHLKYVPNMLSPIKSVLASVFHLFIQTGSKDARKPNEDSRIYGLRENETSHEAASVSVD